MTLRVLTVCTGNTCRSPMAEAILRVRLEAEGISAEVSSVGTLGWSERGASPHAVTVMAEMGLDIADHRSRRIEPAHLDVDLVLAMTRDHAGAVIARDESARAHVFLPSELVRLLRTTAHQSENGNGLPERLRSLGRQRSGPTIGRPAEQVLDPAGEPIAVYRATAQRLDRHLTDLVAALST